MVFSLSSIHTHTHTNTRIETKPNHILVTRRSGKTQLMNNYLCFNFSHRNWVNTLIASLSFEFCFVALLLGHQISFHFDDYFHYDAHCCCRYLLLFLLLLLLFIETVDYIEQYALESYEIP